MQQQGRSESRRALAGYNPRGLFAFSFSEGGNHPRADIERFVEADLAFHATLFEAVDNVFLDALFEPLPPSSTSRTETSSVAQLREHAIEWHAKILTAVTEGDAQAAREMIRGHLIQTEEDTEKFLGPRLVARAAAG